MCTNVCVCLCAQDYVNSLYLWISGGCLEQRTIDREKEKQKKFIISTPLYNISLRVFLAQYTHNRRTALTRAHSHSSHHKPVFCTHTHLAYNGKSVPNINFTHSYSGFGWFRGLFCFLGLTLIPILTQLQMPQQIYSIGCVYYFEFITGNWFRPMVTTDSIVGTCKIPHVKFYRRNSFIEQMAIVNIFKLPTKLVNALMNFTLTRSKHPKSMSNSLYIIQSNSLGSIHSQFSCSVWLFKFDQYNR